MTRIKVSDGTPSDKAEAGTLRRCFVKMEAALSKTVGARGISKGLKIAS